MGSGNFDLLDNLDSSGNQYYPSDDNLTIIEKEIWDELLRANLGSVRSVALDTLLVRTDSILLVDTTAGPVTITLPPASLLSQLTFTIRKVAGPPTNVITVDPAGADTINGDSTMTINFTGSAANIFSDGVSAWFTG